MKTIKLLLLGSLLFLGIGITQNVNASEINQSNNVLEQKASNKNPTRIWKTETRSMGSLPPYTLFVGYRYYTGTYYRGYLSLRSYNYAPGKVYTFEGWLYRSDQPYPIPSMMPTLDLKGEDANE